ILRKLHQTIRKVTEDFSGRWHFNTSVAALMEFSNQCIAAEKVLESAPLAFLAFVQRKFVLFLAPFAAYFSHDLWEMLGEKGNLLRAPWPKYDPELAKEEELEIPVQVNGKLRGLIVVPAGANDELVRERALADDKTKLALAGKTIVKVIVVPAKLVN